MKRISMIVLLAVVLVLAACGPATPADGDVPGTGPTATVPVLSTGTSAPAGDVPAGCVGVDTQALATAGEQVYTANCASCHGAQGEGQGSFPPVAGNADVTGDPLGVIAGYFAVEAHPKTITTDEAAAVFTYIRGAFGNTGQPICPNTVLENRPAQ